MMKSGLVSISFRSLTVEEIIQLTVDCDMQGIEWGGDVHVPHGEVETARRVGQLTQAAGLELASYGSYYRFDECDPDSPDSGPSMESVLDSAEALGAPAVRVWAGRRSPGETSKTVREAITDRAREFAEAALARGIRLDFEYHESTLTETPESALSLMEEVCHSNARSLWQPPLLTSVEKRLEGLKRIKPWVSNLHCNHFDQEPWPNTQPLKNGEAEWLLYLNEINTRPGDRWVLIEHVHGHSPEQLPDDATALKKWLAQLSGEA